MDEEAKSIGEPRAVVRLSEMAREGRRIAKTNEPLGLVAQLPASAGLSRLHVEHEILPPGRRSSSPHAHTTREEIVYVLSGTPQLWLDGHLHPMEPGDFAAFAAGTGVAHAVLNNSDSDVEMLTIATQQDDDLVFYPLASRPSLLPLEIARAWAARPRGPHDGVPAVIDLEPGMQELWAAAQDQDERIDPRWRALAEGRLSEDEIAALAEEAQQTEDGLLLWEIHRPFDADEKERLFEGVCQRMQRRRGSR